MKKDLRCGRADKVVETEVLRFALDDKLKEGRAGMPAPHRLEINYMALHLKPALGGLPEAGE